MEMAGRARAPHVGGNRCERVVGISSDTLSLPWLGSPQGAAPGWRAGLYAHLWKPVRGHCTATAMDNVNRSGVYLMSVTGSHFLTTTQAY